MSPRTRDAKQHAKARRRHYRKAHERLTRDRRQAQHAAEAFQQALDDLGLPEDLVTEIEGRLHSQQKLLGKICGVMCPPLFGCRTNTELCRVRGWDKNLPSRLLGALPKRSWMRLRATSPTYGAVTVIIVREPGVELYYLLYLETAISAPRLIRAWKRRHWIEYCLRTLKHLQQNLENLRRNPYAPNVMCYTNVLRLQGAKSRVPSKATFPLMRCRP